ncbi:MAG: YraN family protein [Thermoguttaceae bacterium]
MKHNSEQRSSDSSPKKSGTFSRYVFNCLQSRLSSWLKYRAPAFWRRHWGYYVPQSDLYEDFCENRKPVVLAKDILGREGEKFVFDKVFQDPECNVIACNTVNYYCEIDIVYLDETTKEIVFVEVKTRRYNGPDFRPEFFALDAKRKKKLALAGRQFIKERGYVEYRDRYDLAVVIFPKDAEPILRYHKAFFTFLSAVRGYGGDDFGKTRTEKYLRDDVRKRLHRDKKTPQD